MIVVSGGRGDGQVHVSILLASNVLYAAGKKRRLTILECSNDVNTMIDVAKVADLVKT